MTGPSLPLTIPPALFSEYFPKIIRRHQTDDKICGSVIYLNDSAATADDSEPIALQMKK